MTIKSLLVVFCLILPITSFSESCYDNKIIEVKQNNEGETRKILVTFEKDIGGTRVHLFTNNHCSRFYDSYICDYKNDELVGWQISSDTDITTHWFIDYCI